MHDASVCFFLVTSFYRVHCTMPLFVSFLVTFFFRVQDVSVCFFPCDFFLKSTLHGASVLFFPCDFLSIEYTAQWFCLFLSL